MRNLLITSGVVLGGLAAIAACATVESDGTNNDPSKIEVPNQDAGPDVISVDGGCDPNDPNCVTKTVTCEEAPWCPSATGVSGFFALTSVWGSSANDVWAGGSGGTLVRWNGTAWTKYPLESHIVNTFFALRGNGPNDVWAVSSTDRLFHFDGAAWTQAPSIADAVYNDRPVYAAYSDGAGYLRVGGFPADFNETPDLISPHNQFERITLNDGGVEFSPRPGTMKVTGIWGASKDDLWEVGDNSLYVGWQYGMALHGIRTPGDREHKWTAVDTQSSVVLRSVWGSSAGDVWLVGDKGTIRHWVTGATEWQVVPAPVDASLYGIWGTAANDVWAVGENGTILHYDGTTWSPSLAAYAVNKVKPNLYGIWGSGTNDIWIVGDGVALHYGGPK